MSENLRGGFFHVLVETVSTNACSYSILSVAPKHNRLYSLQLQPARQSVTSFTSWPLSEGDQNSQKHIQTQWNSCTPCETN